MMAEETGGIAAVNTNDWKANLDQIAADFSNFYSLGYRSRPRRHRPAATRSRSPSSKKGLTVRTRTSFVEKSVETRTAEAVVASLHYARNDNPLGDERVDRRARSPTTARTTCCRCASRFRSASSASSRRATCTRASSSSTSWCSTSRASSPTCRSSGRRSRSREGPGDRAAQGLLLTTSTLIVVPGGQKLAFGVRDGVSNLVVVRPEERLRVGPAEGEAARDDDAGPKARRSLEPPPLDNRGVTPRPASRRPSRTRPVGTARRCRDSRSRLRGMRAADAETIRGGTSSDDLMENAAAGLCAALLGGIPARRGSWSSAVPATTAATGSRRRACSPAPASERRSSRCATRRATRAIPRANSRAR